MNRGDSKFYIIKSDFPTRGEVVRIKYLSHSGFELKNGKTLLIDPYFSGNALAPKYSGKPDLILITHEHFDH